MRLLKVGIITWYAPIVAQRSSLSDATLTGWQRPYLTALDSRFTAICWSPTDFAAPANMASSIDPVVLRLEMRKVV